MIYFEASLYGATTAEQRLRMLGFWKENYRLRSKVDC